MMVSAVTVCVICVTAWSASKDRHDTSRRGKPYSVKSLNAAIEKLRPLALKLGKPKPGEWLYHHKEPGQTFKQYVASDPVVPTSTRKVIVVQPLGMFTKSQRRVVTEAAEFIGRYFNLSVRIEKDLPLSLIPSKARRRDPAWGVDQILTGYVLDDVLKPRLPKDAFAYIAFTASDLWPGKGWNFVFGQASLRGRVGVWSIHRFGDPSKDDKGFRLTLRRTLQTGTHELGHMLSIYHCTGYECNMCGSNSLPESDRRPLSLCPECMAKVCWATRTDPVERYRKLIAFTEKHALKKQAARYRRRLKALTEK